MIKPLLTLLALLLLNFFSLAQVGINTESPQSALDVNGNIQIRQEFRINGNPGLPGQIYFSQGPSTIPQWKSANVSFLEDGQYQLVNTYAKSDQIGIDWVGTQAPINTFPFVETFETTSTTIASWTNERVLGTTDWSYGTGAGATGGTGASGTPTVAFAGTRNARFPSAITNTNESPVTKLVSPIMDLQDMVTPRISFWYAQDRREGGVEGNGRQNRLKVYYRVNSVSSWVELSSYTADIGDWTNVVLSLPNPSNTYQIAFEGINDNGIPNVIDNVVVYDTTYLIETFEDNSPTRASWTNQQVTGSGLWILNGQNGANTSGGTPTTAYEGTRNARFPNALIDLNESPVARLISPSLNLSGMTSAKLNFYYANDARTSGNTNNGRQNTLRVYYRTSPAAAWLLLNTYSADVGTWTNIVLDLPNPSATYQVAFEGMNDYGIPIVLDNVQVYQSIVGPVAGYYTALSPIGENIRAKNWRVIPGLNLPVTINNANNKISIIFQAGVETRMNVSGTGNQIAGSIRYMCGVFRRLTSQPLSTSILVAVRGDQINNTINKPILDKTQSIFTLNYTVDNTPVGNYTFTVACRRNALTGGDGTEATSLMSLGNSVNSGNNVTNDFMLNSILKMDIIELVTTVVGP